MCHFMSVRHVRHTDSSGTVVFKSRLSEKKKKKKKKKKKDGKRHSAPSTDVSAALGAGEELPRGKQYN